MGYVGRQWRRTGEDKTCRQMKKQISDGGTVVAGWSLKAFIFKKFSDQDGGRWLVAKSFIFKFFLKKS